MPFAADVAFASRAMRVVGRTREGDAVVVFRADCWHPWSFAATTEGCAQHFRAYVAHVLETACAVADASTSTHSAHLLLLPERQENARSLSRSLDLSISRSLDLSRSLALSLSRSIS